MDVAGLVCTGCGEIYGAEAEPYRCDACGGPLRVTYAKDVADLSLTRNMLEERSFTHLRYRELLPSIEYPFRVSLKEGGTPLVRADTLSKEIGCDLYLKLESQNPTGSFKDRGTTTELSWALEHSAEEVVVASTGNMGSSVAAYAARANVPATIYVPGIATAQKKKQMETYGAKLIAVEGTYEDAAEQAVAHARDSSAYLLGDYAFRREGEKSVSFEILDEKPEVNTIVLPIGNGTLMAATWKGVNEFADADLIEKKPRLIGVQAAGCNTVVRAFNNETEIEPLARAETKATAIACEDPLDGSLALDALRESGGTGVVVSDAEIEKAAQTLAQKEGVYAEEAAAAPLAALMKEPDLVSEDETVVLVVTGHGLKS